MDADDNPFPPEALSANRSGRLTDAQLQRLRAVARTGWAKRLRIAVDRSSSLRRDTTTRGLLIQAGEEQISGGCPMGVGSSRR